MPKNSSDDQKGLVPEGAPEWVKEKIPREKLPQDLQKIIDKDDGFFDDLYDGQYDRCHP